jgi:hypothetical protein
MGPQKGRLGKVENRIKVLRQLTLNTSYFIVCEATCFGAAATTTSLSVQI